MVSFFSSFLPSKDRVRMWKLGSPRGKVSPGDRDRSTGGAVAAGKFAQESEKALRGDRQRLGNSFAGRTEIRVCSGKGRLCID